MSAERWFCCWSPEQQAIYLERERRVFLENQSAYLLNKPTLQAPLASFDSQEEAERYVEIGLRQRVLRVAKPLSQTSKHGGHRGTL